MLVLGYASNWGSLGAISLHTPGVSTALLSPIPGDSLYVLPFHLRGGSTSSNIRVGSILRNCLNPSFYSLEREAQGGEGAWSTSQPVSAELGLKAEVSEPARGFPGLQAISWPLSYLVLSCLILLKDKGLKRQP